TGHSAKTAPTDRSNSPAVSSRVIASAMMPSSGVKASRFEILSGDRNVGLPMTKSATNAQRMTKEENSGDRAALAQRLWFMLMTRRWNDVPDRRAGRDGERRGRQSRYWFEYRSRNGWTLSLSYRANV